MKNSIPANDYEVQSESSEKQLAGLELINSIIEASDTNGGMLMENRIAVCEFLKNESVVHPELTQQILDLGKKYDYQGYGNLVSHALSCLVIRNNESSGHKKYANELLDRLISHGDFYIALVYSNRLGIYREELVDYADTSAQVASVVT